MIILNRIILLIIAILAGVQIVSGIENYAAISITYFTYSYGIFLVSSLLMMLMGVDIIEHDVAALIATTLPLGFSLGLIAEYFSAYHIVYLVLLVILFICLVILRLKQRSKLALIFQILLHGLSGMVLFTIPIILVIGDVENVVVLWISCGTGFIALGGMSLALLKSGKPVLTKDQIYTIFPGVLLLAVLTFAIGIGKGLDS